MEMRKKNNRKVEKIIEKDAEIYNSKHYEENEKCIIDSGMGKINKKLGSVFR